MLLQTPRLGGVGRHYIEQVLLSTGCQLATSIFLVKNDLQSCAMTTQPWRHQWMRQFNYSSHDWIQTSALTPRATLLRNAKVILVSWSVGIKVKDFSLVSLAVWSDGSKIWSDTHQNLPSIWCLQLKSNDNAVVNFIIDKVSIYARLLSWTKRLRAYNL